MGLVSMKDPTELPRPFCHAKIVSLRPGENPHQTVLTPGPGTSSLRMGKKHIPVGCKPPAHRAPRQHACSALWPRTRQGYGTKVIAALWTGMEEFTSQDIAGEHPGRQGRGLRVFRRLGCSGCTQASCSRGTRCPSTATQQGADGCTPKCVWPLLR